MTKTFEIFWDDLTEECQDRLRDLLDLEPDDDNNWEFIPIASFEFEFEDDVKVEDRIQ